MNIAQISNLSGRGATLLTGMLEQVPLLRFAQFKQDASTHFVIPDKSTFTESAARAVNEAAQRDYQTNNPTSRSLALYERELGIDDVYKKDMNVGVSAAGLRLFADRQLKALGVKLSEEIETDMLQGTDADNRMLGLSVFVKDADAAGQTPKLGFTADEQAAMNTEVGLQLNTEENQDLFIEMLDKELAKVPNANAIIVNPNMKARLNTIARRHGAAGESRDTFGKPVSTFDNVPIVPVSLNAITQAESDGTNNDCTSIYIVRFSEDLGVCFSTNSGFKFDDFEEIEAQPAGMSRLGFYLNLTIEKQNAMKRLSRIRL